MIGKFLMIYKARQADNARHTILTMSVIYLRIKTVACDRLFITVVVI